MRAVEPWRKRISKAGLSSEKIKPSPATAKVFYFYALSMISIKKKLDAGKKLDGVNRTI
jgi:hypothetical protein